MFYAQSTGGFYNVDIHGQQIPGDAVEISEQHYQKMLSDQSIGLNIVTDADGLPMTVEYVIDPIYLKTAALRRIDVAAEQSRLQFITPGAGQALVYQRKESQARACLATYNAQNPPPAGAYPALDAEINITGNDALAVAAVITALADAWGAVADAIETLRLVSKAAIAAVPDTAPDIEAQIAAIESGITWPAP